jgi:16S rRNA (cytosine967-C5)-methyltransferase
VSSSSANNNSNSKSNDSPNQNVNKGANSKSRVTKSGDACKAMDVRIAAALALTAVMRDGHSLTHALNCYSQDVIERDKGLLQELCFGVARYAPAFELLTTKLIDKPIKAKETDVKALLYIGIYQLLYMRIPNHAAINSVVEATKALKKNWATGLLNGVLRRLTRDGESIIASLTHIPQYAYAHPQWFIELVIKAWPEHWRAILEGNNQHPPLTLRINQQRTTRTAFAEQLTTTDTPSRTYTLGNYSPQALTLDEASAVPELPGYNQGWFAVQDEAAQLSAELLQLQPQQRVLDACCAPGGKSCHILEKEPNIAELVAIDVDEQRMTRVADNLARLGHTATLIIADAANTQAWWDGKPFDRILLDAPCSATGVIRRHPDIKLLRRADDIAKLAALQQQLLHALWPTLAEGGLMVYATCSVLPQENECSVKTFLSQTPDAQALAITAATWGLERPFGRQLFPQQHGHDGFYYCVLQKSGTPQSRNTP